MPRAQVIYYSSARFYETSVDDFGFLHRIMKVF
jgi:hypothetical protein